MLLSILLFATIFLTTAYGQSDNCSSNMYPDLVLVLDESGSICDTDPDFHYGIDSTCNNFKNYTKFLHELVAVMEIGPNKTMIGAVRFESEASVLWKLDKYQTKSDLLNAIDSIQYVGGSTATTAGLRRMRTDVFGQSGDRPDHPNYAIVVTDGKATIDVPSLPSEIMAVQSANITVYVVGVTSSVNLTQIKAISSSPHLNEVNYFQSTSFQSLDRVKNSLLKTTNIVCRTEVNTPAPVNKCTSKLYPDLTLVIDVSGSICDTDVHGMNSKGSCTNFESYIDFIIELINLQPISRSETLVALVMFESRAYVKWELDAYPFKDDLKEAIRSLKYTGGYTATSEALNLMRTKVFNTPADRKDHPNVAIVITDGRPTISAETLPFEIEEAHKANISVFAIGITNSIDEIILSNISSMPHRLNVNYFMTSDFSTLKNLDINLILNCEENKATENECTGDLYPDLVFALDKSGSICDTDIRVNNSCRNFINYMAFVYSLVDKLTIGPGATFVSVVSFDDDARVEWPLNKYQTKAELLATILNIKYTGGWTNTAQALRLVRTSVLQPPGDRPANPNVVIIITDGNATIQVDELPTEIQLLMQLNVKMFSVGVTDQIDVQRLKNMSSYPHKLGKNYFVSTNFSTLSSIEQELLTKTGLGCSTPSVITPNNPCTGSRYPDLVFVLDQSGSICSPVVNGSCANYDQYITFVSQLIDSISVSYQETHVAVVTFDYSARVLWKLNGYLVKEDLLDAIKSIRYNNGPATDTSTALRLIRTDIFNTPSDRKESPNIAIVITDGGANVNKIHLENEVLLNERANIKTFVLGVGSGINLQEIILISSPPKQLGKSYFTATDFSSLSSLKKELLVGTGLDCDNKALTTMAPSTKPFCTKTLQLAFIIDDSASVGSTKFSAFLKFAQTISIFVQNNGLLKLALITYDTTAKVQWGLSTFSNASDIERKMQGLQYVGADTNTTGAIRTCRLEVFNGTLQGRKVAILLTDGFNAVNINRLKTEVAMLGAIGVDLFVAGDLVDPMDGPDLEGVLPAPNNKLNLNYFMNLNDDIAAILQNRILPNTCD